VHVVIGGLLDVKLTTPAALKEEVMAVLEQVTAVLEEVTVSLESFGIANYLKNSQQKISKVIFSKID
jgi:hypothetical protein